MRKIRALFVLLSLSGFAVLAGCQHPVDIHSAMSYNIRLDLNADGDNAWRHRQRALTEQVRITAPDFLGLQEAKPNQMEDIATALPGYRTIGIGREGGKAGEFSAIFYNTKEWSKNSEATFWLSDTPAQKSMGWDAAFLRICTYGLFTHQASGKKLWVFNTHLDHMGNEARHNSLSLIKTTLNEVNTEGYPVILMGDMNAEPEDPIFKSITPDFIDARDLSRKPPTGPMATFNAFNKNEIPSRRIDYIFVSKPNQFKIHTHSVLDAKANGSYISDHFPVLIKFTLK